MARELKIKSAEHDPGLYDSATGKNLDAEKVVDITDDCPGANQKRRAVLLFTTAQRGRIVQMARPYPKEVYTGRHIHFFVDELENEMRAAESVVAFGSWAKELGLSKSDLRAMIEKHAPTVHR